MVTTTLRNAIAKIGNTRSHIKISDYAKTPAIPIRHLAIGFKGKDIDISFYRNRGGPTCLNN